MLTNPAVAVEQQPIKADTGTAKIPITLLGEAVKPGDRVSLTVTGVDTIAGMVTVVADSPTEAVPEAPAGAVGTDVTMGPIDDLKSFLYKKTMEKEA